ncbi:hypothetical protein, partial [Anaplasma bovis]|uniref:hypothetical protein n=1 Tax=Anaplasma bovis TaxID=186733 RepID=UPI002FF203F4
KKVPLLSSVSKALKIKYKKAKCAVSKASITHLAANDSPSEKLSSADIRPFPDVVHKKVSLSSR